MSKIRGKKLTVAQMKIINKSTKDIDFNEWLYYGEEAIDDSGSKCVSKNNSKTKYIKIIHKTSGEVRKFLMS